MNFIFAIFLLGGQICTDSVNISQDGEDRIGRNRVTIVPRLNFTCNGRITNIRAKMSRSESRWYLPYFQIWRPVSLMSTIYNKTQEVQLEFGHVTVPSDSRASISITLTDDKRLEFQSGDVIGFYHPDDARYQLRTIRTKGYIRYEFSGSSTLASVDLNTDSNVMDERQPLIQFTIGKSINSYIFNFFSK